MEVFNWKMGWGCFGYNFDEYFWKQTRKWSQRENKKWFHFSEKCCNGVFCYRVFFANYWLVWCRGTHTTWLDEHPILKQVVSSTWGKLWCAHLEFPYDVSPQRIWILEPTDPGRFQGQKHPTSWNSASVWLKISKQAHHWLHIFLNQD